jgi:hypothetical protein
MNGLMMRRKTGGGGLRGWVSAPACIALLAAVLVVAVLGNYVWWFKSGCEKRVVEAQEVSAARVLQSQGPNLATWPDTTRENSTSI